MTTINELGKLPPQAVDVEYIVLGSLMLERDALAGIADIFHPELFYKQEHELIARAILNLDSDNEPIDIITVTNKLRQQGVLEKVGGAFYISELTNRIGSTANLEYHTRILNQKYLCRRLIEMCGKISADAFNETVDIFDILDGAEKSLTSIVSRLHVSKIATFGDYYNKALALNDKLLTSVNGIPGVPSGFIDIDKVTGGWMDTDLVIIAARPGMGKTSFVLQVAEAAAVRFQKCVGMLSLEMGGLQLVNRLRSQKTTIKLSKYMKYGLDKEHLEKDRGVCMEIVESKLFIDDTAGLTLYEIKSKARKLKRDNNLDVLFIDYLGLITPDTSNKNYNTNNQLGAVTVGLKNLAKELNIPVVVLCQLSRDVEKRGGDKIPQLSDLRDSGNIEQDADQVIFIYRPEYYKKTTNENGQPLPPGQAIFNIAKNRNGPTGDVELRWKGEHVKFYDKEIQ